MLLGKRIRLRAIEQEDLEKMAEWRNQPETYEYFYEYFPLSKASQQMWYENLLRKTDDLMFVISTLAGKAIGTVAVLNINWRNRNAEWGRFLIGEKDYMAKGYGIEAELLILEYVFEHLNLNRLYGEVLVDNTRVRSLHKKCGFQEEGLLRQHIYKQGKYCDVIIVGMLKEDYFSHKHIRDGLWESLHERE